MEAAAYLFIPSLAWHFHGLICFNPRESCRRNRFLVALIKLIFCRAGSNGQNVTPVAFCVLVGSHNSTSCSFICFSGASEDTSAQSCFWSLRDCTLGLVQVRIYGAEETMPMLFFYFILPNNALKYGVRENASGTALRPSRDVNARPLFILSVV